MWPGRPPSGNAGQEAPSPRATRRARSAEHAPALDTGQARQGEREDRGGRGETGAVRGTLDDRRDQQRAGEEPEIPRPRDGADRHAALALGHALDHQGDGHRIQNSAAGREQHLGD
jgi:hypothetical protein